MKFPLALGFSLLFFLAVLVLAVAAACNHPAADQRGDDDEK